MSGVYDAWMAEEQARYEQVQAMIARTPSVPGYHAPTGTHQRWAAPDTTAAGQFTVDRAVLRHVSARMHNQAQDLSAALTSLINGGGGGGAALSGWPAAEGFGENAVSALYGIMMAVGTATTAHHDAAARLSATEAAYQRAEIANEQASVSVMNTLDQAQGTVNAAAAHTSALPAATDTAAARHAPHAAAHAPRAPLPGSRTGSKWS